MWCHWEQCGKGKNICCFDCDERGECTIICEEISDGKVKNQEDCRQYYEDYENEPMKFTVKKIPDGYVYEKEK